MLITLLEINVLLKIAQVARKWKKLLFEATYDGMFTDHKPVYAKAYASILPTDLHTNGEIK